VQEVEEIGEQAKQEAKMEATIAKLQRCLFYGPRMDHENGPWIWVNFITTSLFSRTLEILVEGNHSQMAQQFR